MCLSSVIHQQSSFSVQCLSLIGEGETFGIEIIDATRQLSLD